MNRPESENGNGTAVDHEWEDSAEHFTGTLANVANIPNEIGGIIHDSIKSGVKEAVAAIGGGGPGGGGNVPPEVHKKQIKRHNWAAVVLAAILGPGGAFAVLNAMDDRSKANEMKIEQVQAADTAMEPRIDVVEDDVRFIKARVGDLGVKVDEAMVQQQVIVTGINQLKEESVKNREKRLREENERLRERLRRRGR